MDIMLLALKEVLLQELEIFKENRSQSNRDMW